MCCLHLSNQGSRFNFFGTQRHGDTELFIKNIREATDLVKGRLCVFVSLCSKKRDAIRFSDCFLIYPWNPCLNLYLAPSVLKAQTSPTVKFSG